MVKQDEKFKVNNLIYLMNEENLKESFYELKRGKSPGVDGMTLEEYERNLTENIKELIGRMRKWQYRPQPVKRVYIGKEDGKKRPIGIPTVEDKLVQMQVKRILEPIYEIDCLNFSYGFRPKRNCHQALDAVDKMIMKNNVNYILDADIKGFFDNVDHKWMLRCLEERIGDKKLLRLIVRILKSGIMEEGKYTKSEKGTPQGGILSPLLANIYLHYILDIWVLRKVRKECKGYVGIVRYADDFVIGIERKEETEKVLELLKNRMEKFGLEISTEKTRIVKFGRKAGKGNTFNFLRLTHYNDKTRKGKYKVGRKTEKKRFKRAVQEMNMWLRKIRNMVEMRYWWKILQAKMRGHFQYYGVSGNMPSLKRYYKEVTRLVFKWSNRRSQKKSYDWVKFKEYIKIYSLPQPKIHHNLYTLYGY